MPFTNYEKAVETWDIQKYGKYIGNTMGFDLIFRQFIVGKVVVPAFGMLVKDRGSLILNHMCSLFSLNDCKSLS